MFGCSTGDLKRLLNEVEMLDTFHIVSMQSDRVSGIFPKIILALLIPGFLTLSRQFCRYESKTWYNGAQSQNLHNRLLFHFSLQP